MNKKFFSGTKKTSKNITSFDLHLFYRSERYVRVGSSAIGRGNEGTEY